MTLLFFFQGLFVWTGPTSERVIAIPDENRFIRVNP